MKKRKGFSRAVALLLLLCLAVTMCTSCTVPPDDGTGDHTTSSNPGMTESNPSSNPSSDVPPEQKPMSAKEYFSELRLLKTDTGGYALKNTQTLNGVSVQLPMYGNTELSNTPMLGLSQVTSRGFVFAKEKDDVVYLLDKDGLSALFKVPWASGEYGHEVIAEIGASDEDVIFFRTTNYHYPTTTNLLRRYYVAEQKCDIVLDLNGETITAYLDRWQGEITAWQAINNQEIALTVRPMYEHKTTSKAYKTFLKEEVARLTDDPDAQKAVKTISDGKSTEEYRPVIVYNTELKTCQVLYTLAQQKAYLAQFDLDYTRPEAEDANAKPTVHKGNVSGTAMSYKEYFSEMRIPWKEGTGAYYTRSEKILLKDTEGFTSAFFSYYDGQKLSVLPMYSFETAAGILIADNHKDGARLLRLSKDGTECLVEFPSGTCIENIQGADSHVVFMQVTTGSVTHCKQYMYRYFIPDGKLELVADPDEGKAAEVSREHKGVVVGWDVYSNENVLMHIRPMYGYEMESEEYIAYLKAQIQRHKDNPERKQELERVLEHDVQWGAAHYVYVDYNLRTGKKTVLYTRAEYADYQHRFGVNVEV